jgi:hypothetical protein
MGRAAPKTLAGLWGRGPVSLINGNNVVEKAKPKTATLEPKPKPQAKPKPETPLKPEPAPRRKPGPPPLVRDSSTWPPYTRKSDSTWPPQPTVKAPSSTWPPSKKKPNSRLNLGWPPGDLIDEQAEVEEAAPAKGKRGAYGSYAAPDPCGCFPRLEDQVDLERLARHLYDLLRREAYVERERLGIG